VLKSASRPPPTDVVVLCFPRTIAVMRVASIELVLERSLLSVLLFKLLSSEDNETGNTALHSEE
jgi:hypothetical protein